MGIKLLVVKDRDSNQYRHYLQEFVIEEETSVCVEEDGLCPEHTSYLVEIVNGNGSAIVSFKYVTGTSVNTFGKAGKISG